MIQHLWRILRDQRGATAVEYGLIISLMVIAMLVGLGEFADTTISMWGNVADAVEESS